MKNWNHSDKLPTRSNRRSKPHKGFAFDLVTIGQPDVNMRGLSIIGCLAMVRNIQDGQSTIAASNAGQVSLDTTEISVNCPVLS